MYYLYRHIRLDKNEPFYIGQGTVEKDETYLRAYDFKRRTDFWKRIYNKTEIRVEIIYFCDSEEAINKKEVEFIKLYGRRDLKTGSLVNLTDGGQGRTNIIITEETRKIISNNSKRLWKTSSSIRKTLENLKWNPERNKKYAHSIICITTGEEFESISEAARKYNIEKSAIIKNCSGAWSRVEDKQFKYKNPTNKQMEIIKRNKKRLAENKLKTSSRVYTWLLNTETGIYYKSYREAALSINTSPQTLQNYLIPSRNKKARKTYPFILV